MTISANDEQYWSNLRKQFHLDDNSINFRSNAASPIPRTVLDFLHKELNHIQSLPSVYHPGIRSGAKEILRVSLAETLNCSVAEVALMRNTTEALNNVIMGFPFAAGDEVVAGCHEYDSMMASLCQRKLKDGIVVKTIDVPYKPSSKEEIIAAFEKSISPRTKMFLISHIVWISGQVYPVKELCELAARHGIATVIDAAQSFSHIPVDVKEIGCDYLGSSLHKWCTAPIGTGFLYVRKEMIAKTFPLISAYRYAPGDNSIEKFEETGTITPVFDAASHSLAFWKEIGLPAKMQRMQFLKNYAATQLAEIPGLKIVSNTGADHSCGIVYFEVEGRSAAWLKEQLWQQHSITVQAIENYRNDYVDYKTVNAVGIATPVFIMEKDILLLAEALKDITN